MRSKNVLMGISLIVLACYIVVYKLGLITFQIGIWTIIFTIILGVGLINGLLKLNIPMIVFSITLLLMLYAAPLHITVLVPWTLILIAVLITIGLSLVLKKTKFKVKHHFTTEPGNNTDTTHDEVININIKLTSLVRYIKAPVFKAGRIKVLVAELKVYFNNTKIEHEASLNIDATASEVTLYIPKNWHVNNQITGTINEIEETGMANAITDATLYLTGDANVSQIKIIYI